MWTPQLWLHLESDSGVFWCQNSVNQLKCPCCVSVAAHSDTYETILYVVTWFVWLCNVLNMESDGGGALRAAQWCSHAVHQGAELHILLHFCLASCFLRFCRKDGEKSRKVLVKLNICTTVNSCAYRHEPQTVQAKLPLSFFLIFLCRVPCLRYDRIWVSFEITMSLVVRVVWAWDIQQVYNQWLWSSLGLDVHVHEGAAAVATRTTAILPERGTWTCRGRADCADVVCDAHMSVPPCWDSRLCCGSELSGCQCQWTHRPGRPHTPSCQAGRARSSPPDPTWTPHGRCSYLKIRRRGRRTMIKGKGTLLVTYTQCTVKCVLCL